LIESQLRVGLRQIGDPVHFAVELAAARERQRPLAGNVGKLERNVQPRVDRAQQFAADELVGDVGNARQADDRLRMRRRADRKHRNDDEQCPPHWPRLRSRSHSATAALNTIRKRAGLSRGGRPVSF
jgi:hypothetical protein